MIMCLQEQGACCGFTYKTTIRPQVMLPESAAVVVAAYSLHYHDSRVYSEETEQMHHFLLCYSFTTKRRMKCYDAQAMLSLLV